MGIPELDRDAQLWETIASTANHAATLEQAAQQCLDAVCSLTGWPVGHLYVVTGSALVPTTVWHLEDPEGFPALRQATATASLAVGDGLPGEVAACGRPVWIADVTQHPNFPRAGMTDGLQVGGVFAFPILRVWRDADTVSIVVADNGMGIPDEEQPRQFQRFFRSSAATKQAIPGTGLGLVIVRAIVEGHGGRVSLRSSSDVGTEVTITLPVDSAPPRHETDDGSPTPSALALSPTC